MLTPRFTLSQDESHVTIEIEAPFAHVKETEVFMQDNLFSFYSSPYYLRLHFSGFIKEDETASARYDGDLRKFIVAAPKVCKGEHFENLEMLTALLTPKGTREVKKGIEECFDSGSESDEVDIDWLMKQEIPPEEELATGCYYGFANQHIGVFSKLQDELSEVIDVCSPDNKSSQQRSTERQAAERADFDENHYLADKMEEGEIISHLLNVSSEKVIGNADLSREQKDQMIDLKQKNFKLDTKELKQACLTLVDILFAYCYDKHASGGECNVESGWCIAKLSSSLSWLESHENITKTIITCMRRSLCYPLYRNWNLSKAVLDDTKWLLIQGRKQILKALLEIHCLLLESEPRYILNQLYIDDMCIWIQQADDSVIKGLSDSLSSVHPEKSSMDLELEELEAAANLVLQEEAAADVAASMQQLGLDSDDSGESDEDSNSDDSTDSSSSASDDDSSDETSSEEDSNCNRSELVCQP